MEDSMLLENSNNSSVTTFFIVGFPGTLRLQILYFIIFLLIYILTLLGNITLLVTLKKDRSLHKPMYFFLSNLSVLEISFTSVTLPKLLAITIGRMNSISFTGCIVQMYLFFFLGTTECLLLVTMAYDRYLAICHPLRYQILMCNRTCICLVLGSWTIGFINPCIPIVLLSRLLFCKNIIDHFFCDIPPLLSLSCTSNYVTRMVVYTFSSIIILSTFFLTMLSYGYILATILRMSSTNGKQKAFSTCSAHLTVVLLFYGTVTFMYVNPTTQQSMKINKVISFIYSVVTPMFNPLIYSLRNEDVKKSLKRMILKTCFHKRNVTLEEDHSL